MKQIKVSIGVKKDICAVLLLEEGSLYQKKVQKIREKTDEDNHFDTLIYAFKLSLRMLRSYIEKANDECSVIFEVNNSNFIKWLEQGYSKDNYQAEFIEALDLLNELPIKYDYVFAQKTLAKNYTDGKYIEKSKISSLDI